VWRVRRRIWRTHKRFWGDRESISETTDGGRGQHLRGGRSRYESIHAFVINEENKCATGRQGRRPLCRKRGS